MSLLSLERKNFHKILLENNILCFSKASVEHAKKHGVNYISCIADIGNKGSVAIANHLTNLICVNTKTDANKLTKKPKGQSLGDQFEVICKNYLIATFLKLNHIRPGNWHITKDGNYLGNFEQYSHLNDLERLMSTNNELRTFLGEGYTIKPDIVVARSPLSDEEINSSEMLVDNYTARKTAIRKVNHNDPRHPSFLLHASVSCKFTMRSDRAQNTRTEALNLIRSRKGRVPHIVAVTAEPMAGRIASLALGTGDMDCVYHFALNELQQTYQELELHDALDTLETMIDGKRLKDISDLPLDLTV
ncbi:NgoMIV family type II restriction endonuclease [Thalassospira alkalitolerans]|uniref:Restriction endonuclease NgoMIV n=1 Tax=Thalassospira alkalitolerans TaxID=1293890 RepID=A0A1Y2L7Y4_9PROT|nr:NgoMIV family type II restriction endonuclease [Thalassospira alkalitolerans]OSQ45306.1 hypothetical protein TALK_17720 [Thalassospira alkalitolerans]